MSGGATCPVCLSTSDSGTAMKRCDRADCGIAAPFVIPTQAISENSARQYTADMLDAAETEIKRLTAENTKLRASIESML